MHLWIINIHTHELGGAIHLVMCPTMSPKNLDKQIFEEEVSLSTYKFSILCISRVELVGPIPQDW